MPKPESDKIPVTLVRVLGSLDSIVDFLKSSLSKMYFDGTGGQTLSSDHARFQAGTIPSRILLILFFFDCVGDGIFG